MKKNILFVIVLLCLKSAVVMAQVPEDAIRYSWLPHNGTARYMAIGGVMGSLGGDISAAFVNPAGLGFFRTGEAVFSPGFLMNRNKTSFRDGATSKDTKNSFNLGTSGWIKGTTFKNDPTSGNTYSVAFNQVANFNNVIHYSGLNNYSSFSEQFAEEFSASGKSIDEILNTNSALPYTSAPALYTYLIDTVWDGSKYIVRGSPETILDAGQALKQDMLKITSGGMYELGISLAENRKGKWLLGGTLGIPIVNFKSNTVFTESDTSSGTANLFKSATFTDNFKTLGIGLNVKLGIIYRPEEYIRLGFAIHTPSIIYQTDKRTTSLFNAREGSDSLREEYVSSIQFTQDGAGENKYIQVTPLKAMISASYVFREVENVKKQRAFISADIEYTNHNNTRFLVEEDTEENAEKKSYYKSLNKTLKDIYKGAFNFRVGGELKFNVMMARLGFAYYTNPYKNVSFKANKMLLSGGLGYRNKGYFIDVTYVHNMNKDADFPYRLQARDNTYASIKQTQGNISATFGVKF
ncbi:MAG: hypothetical protein WKF35_05525 [Ferruginibacter sp.]